MTESRAVIRRLGPADGPLLAAAVARLVPPEERPLGPPGAEHLTRALADPACYVFLAAAPDAGGELPVGYVSAYRFPALEHEGDRVYLYDLSVEPAHRGRGLGTRLVGALVARCRADGVRAIWAGTARENAAARRAFEATGARPDGESYVEYIWYLAETSPPGPA